jgi:hypothetical protein
MGFSQVKAIYHQVLGCLAPYVPELLAMRAGLRAAIQLSFSSPEEFDAEIPSLVRLCEQSGFVLDVREANHEQKVFLSVAKLDDIEYLDEHRMGELFGYPACCIDAFTGSGKDKELLDDSHVFPLVNRIRGLISRSDSFAFPMNIFLRTSPFNLYKHLPCSLDCDQTLDYARQVLRIVGDANPELHDHIVRFSRTTALYTDICASAILFEGRRVNNRIDYNDFFYEYEPSGALDMSLYNLPEDCDLFAEIVAALGRGDRLVLTGRHLEVKRDRKRVHRFSRPDHLLWKLVEFS